MSNEKETFLLIESLAHPDTSSFVRAYLFQGTYEELALFHPVVEQLSVYLLQPDPLTPAYQGKGVALQHVETLQSTYKLDSVATALAFHLSKLSPTQREAEKARVVALLSGAGTAYTFSKSKSKSS